MNRTPPFPGLTLARSKEQVVIPNSDGKGIARTIEVEVEVWIDAETGEKYLDAQATEELDRAKARHVGLLDPEQLLRLRQRLGLSQKTLSELLQIGEKTWTRWETGRERPSRSMNVLLCALRDNRIDKSYLVGLRDGGARSLCRMMQFDHIARACYTYAPGSGPGILDQGEAHEASACAS